MFNAFRRSPSNYWCYNEPIHEALSSLDNEPDRLLETTNDLANQINHPELAQPYFWEFYKICSSLNGLFHKSFSYDDFFFNNSEALSKEQIKYFTALISNAHGRPVFQFCRSSGRVRALKQAFGGTHIHLWRNSRNQWWSYKVSSYFDATLQLIYNAKHLPSALLEVKHLCNISTYHNDNIDKELEHAIKRPLASRANYFAFYALWLYSFHENNKYSDITISMEQLSTDKEYRNETIKNLSRLEVQHIDFSDSAIPQLYVSDEEEKFFEEIEKQVASIFVMHGYQEESLNKAVIACKKSATPENTSDTNLLINNISQARRIALRLLDRAGYTENLILHAEVQIQTANEQAQHATKMLQDITTSLSWRYTKPLRWLRNKIRTKNNK